MILLALGVLAAVASVALRPRPAEDQPAPPPAPATAPPAPPAPAPRRPPPPVNPIDSRLDSVPFTEEQRAAFLEAGRAIQNGVVPSTVLTPAQRTTLAELQKVLEETVCPLAGSDPSCGGYRIDIDRCLDRAGEIVAWRRKERDNVDRRLFTAAMGVSVVGREYPSYQTLVKFCREMAALDVKPAS